VIHRTHKDIASPLAAIAIVAVPVWASAGPSLIVLSLRLIAEIAFTTPRFPVRRVLRLIQSFVHLVTYL
jgi:hypothetical protein